MVVRTHDCDRNRLRLLLSDDLDDRSRSETEQHLACCQDCQAALMSLAGGGQWWEDASRFLQRDDHDTADCRQPGGPPTLWRTCNRRQRLRPLTSCCPSWRRQTIQRRWAVLEVMKILEVIGQGGMGVVLKDMTEN